MFQYVARCSQLAEWRILHICHQSLTAHLILWHMSFHRYTFQCVVVHLHPYDSHFRLAANLIDGLVTDVGDAGKDFRLFVWNGEVAAFVRYTATKQRGVGRIEDSNVGICHWLALFIDDGARQVAVGLVDTLHIDFSVVGLHGHADRVEAYHLLDGIGQFLVLDGGCDAEVLQFVVEEVDDVFRLLVVQLEQSLAERHIIIGMANALCEGSKWHAKDAGHERQSI